MNLFNRKHRRSPSHFNLKYGRENSPPDSPVKEVRGSPVHQPYGAQQPDVIARDDLEVSNNNKQICNVIPNNNNKSKLKH